MTGPVRFPFRWSIRSGVGIIPYVDLDALKAEDPGRLGDYVLRGRLGEGGQGVVYLGESPSHGRAAVKLLRPGFADDAGTLERFVREAETAQRVAPFCTAQIFASG